MYSTALKYITMLNAFSSTVLKDTRDNGWVIAKINTPLYYIPTSRRKSVAMRSTCNMVSTCTIISCTKRKLQQTWCTYGKLFFWLPKVIVHLSVKWGKEWYSIRNHFEVERTKDLTHHCQEVGKSVENYPWAARSLNAHDVHTRLLR